jgi:hypothetical protein
MVGDCLNKRNSLSFWLILVWMSGGYLILWFLVGL